MSYSVSFNLTIKTTNHELIKLMARVPAQGFFNVLYNQDEDFIYSQNDFYYTYAGATLKVGFDLPLFASEVDLKPLLSYEGTTVEGCLASDDGYNAVLQDNEWVSTEDYDF